MGELINGRTLQEIKAALCVCISEEACNLYGCYYSADRNCRDSVMRDALALIQYLEAKQPKWISVKERLPVKQLRVIVQTGHGLVTTGWRSYHVDVRGGELWEVDGAHNYHNDVTHWMPTPEPKENE